MPRETKPDEPEHWRKRQESLHSWWRYTWHDKQSKAFMRQHDPETSTASQSQQI
jgi:hypothetical protein